MLMGVNPRYCRTVKEAARASWLNTVVRRDMSHKWHFNVWETKNSGTTVANHGWPASWILVHYCRTANQAIATAVASRPGQYWIHCGVSDNYFIDVDEYRANYDEISVVMFLEPGITREYITLRLPKKPADDGRVFFFAGGIVHAPSLKTQRQAP